MMIKKTLVITIPYLIIGTLCFAMGYWYASGQTPVVPSPVRHLVTPKDVMRLDIPSFRSVPTMQFIHVERTDTVTKIVEVKVPKGFEVHGVVERQPVSVSHDRVHFQYFNPGSLELVTERYEVPVTRWRYDFGVRAQLSPFTLDSWLAGVYGELGYGRLSLTGGVDYDFDRDVLMPKVGFKIHFFN